MRNLPPPSREGDRADLRLGVRRYRYKGVERGHAITEGEIDDVLALYDRYEADLGAACDDLKGQGLPESLQATIHAAFGKTQVGRILHPLRERLFQGVQLCPACGIGAPVELDHHLPQSVFRPLAIHARNLVPMCHACNLAKLAGFGEDGASGFVHPYYDLLPDVDLLRAVAELDGAALDVRFEVAVAAGLPDDLSRRLVAQFEALDLDVRYQKEVNAYILSQAAALHLGHMGGGQQGVRSVLSVQARFEADALHRNHWRPALLRSLAAHDGFTGGGFAAALPMPQDMIDDLAA